MPGARVFILVDKIVRTQEYCYEEKPILYVPGDALQAGQEVFAYQRICDRESRRWEDGGTPVTVTMGNMKVSVSPPNPIPRNASSQITITATDADTNEGISDGAVEINNELVGSLNKEFSLNPSKVDPSANDPKVTSLSATALNDGYYPGFFHIQLASYWTLELQLSPTDTPTDEKYNASIAEATWEITPDWTAALPLIGNASAGWIHQSIPIILPPENGRTIKVELKAIKVSVLPPIPVKEVLDLTYIQPTVNQGKVVVLWKVSFSLVGGTILIKINSGKPIYY